MSNGSGSITSRETGQSWPAAVGGNHETIDHPIDAAEACVDEGSFLHRCCVMLCTWSERARQRRALAALDDRLLRDIGVTLDAAKSQGAMPFWRPSAGARRWRFSARTVSAPPAESAGTSRTRRLLEDPIVPTLLRLAAPNVAVNIVLIASTATVDAHFVGKLGPGALAGLSLVFPLLMLMQQMANSSMGGAVAGAVARAIGAGRHADASALVFHAVMIAAGMPAIFASVLLMGGPAIYTLMGGDGETRAAALEYSNVIFAGAVVYWLLSTLTSVVRGAGQATVLAVVYLASQALHILLVPALMFGVGPFPPLGIAGAGIATVASFAGASAFLAWYIASGRTAVRLSLRGVRPSRRQFAEILRVGAPMSLQPILNNLALAALTSFVGAVGAAELAAFGAAVRLEYLLYPLAFGLGAGALALVGTNIGAGNLARAARSAWIAAALAAGVTGSIGLFGIAAPDAWIRLFTDAPEIHALAVRYLVVVSVAYPFLGLGLTLASSFQVAGRPLSPLCAITSRALIVVVGGGIAVYVAKASLGGLGLVAAAGLIVYGAGLAVAFRAGLWQKPRAG